MDRAAIEIMPDRGLTMDLLFEISQPVRDDDSIRRIDSKGARMQLDVHSLAIPDVKLIRTPRFSDARGYFCETFQRADFAVQGLDNDFLQFRSAGNRSWPALSTASFRPDEAGSCAAREHFRCGCRSSPFFTKLWKAYCHKAEQ